MTEADRQILGDLRSSLLRLHKTLLDWERSGYERLNGRTSSSELLTVITTDQRFAWLRPFSELIVRIDSLLDAGPEAPAVAVGPVVGQAQTLVTPDEEGTAHARRYFTALQEHPDAVIAHRGVTQVLTRAPRGTLH